MTTTQVEFQVIDGWEKTPDDAKLKHEDVAAVAVDSQDRVYLHTRNGDRVMVFEPDGKFIGAWGDGVFGNAHGITIGPDDSLYCTDNKDHVVRKFTPEGKLLMTFGTPGQNSDTGYDTTGKPKTTTTRRWSVPPDPSTPSATRQSRQTATSSSRTVTAMPACTTSSRTAAWSSPGAKPAPVMGNSTSRMASPSRTTAA